MIGVLDLQGGVAEHVDHLRRIGIPCRGVKHASDLSGIAGLIIPGGESTCISRLIRLFGLRDAVIGEFRRGLKIWGTCAGAILLARAIVGESPHLALIDMEIERNGFGSQLDSFAGEALVSRVAPHPIPLTFIRAPKITRVGHGVDVLLEMNGYIAAAESPGVLATVFHPELTGSLAFHRYFANKCRLMPADDRGRVPQAPPCRRG
jgi:pyridoxal 5'-phosphate synthase pdxT subunit